MKNKKPFTVEVATKLMELFYAYDMPFEISMLFCNTLRKWIVDVNRNLNVKRSVRHFFEAAATLATRIESGERVTPEQNLQTMDAFLRDLGYALGDHDLFDDLKGNIAAALQPNESRLVSGAIPEDEIERLLCEDAHGK